MHGCCVKVYNFSFIEKNIFNYKFKIMKSLKGMKNTISSFENNRLSNLVNVNGGLADYPTVVSSTSTECGSNCADRTECLDSGKSRTITFTF